MGLTADIYRLDKFVVSSEREGNAKAITLQRQSGGAGDLSYKETNLINGDHANIGNAHRRRHRRARQIMRVKASRLRLQRRLAIMRAGHP